MICEYCKSDIPKEPVFCGWRNLGIFDKLKLKIFSESRLRQRHHSLVVKSHEAYFRGNNIMHVKLLKSKAFAYLILWSIKSHAQVIQNDSEDPNKDYDYLLNGHFYKY